MLLVMNRIVKCYHVNKWNLILYKYIVTNNFFPTSHLTTNNEQLSSLPKVHIVCSQIFEGQNWIILSLLCRQHYFKVIEVFLWYFESGLLNLWVLIVSVCVCSECQAGRWAASSRCVCVCVDVMEERLWQSMESASFSSSARMWRGE